MAKVIKPVRNRRLKNLTDCAHCELALEWNCNQPNW